MYEQQERAMCQDGRFPRRSVWTCLCLGLLLVALPGRTALSQSLASAVGQQKLARAQGHDANTPRDQAEAWKWMQKALKNAGISNPRLDGMTVTGTTADKKPFLIHLSFVTSVTLEPDVAVPFGLTAKVHWYEFPYISSLPGTLEWSQAFLSVAAITHSRRFYAALGYLAHTTQDDAYAQAAAALEDFKPKAEAWRKMAVKPAMPEQARAHQVLAEYAFKHKDVVKAMEEYSQALDIFPYWPEGHYDLATMAAEIGGAPGYRIAIFHMEKYLALTPDAPDAQAASDSIIVWKDKWAGGRSAPSPASGDGSASSIN
ncbi:MAG: tetratricopeptide repeat protein [Acidobacteriaceae bacterium]